jgi:hypothetical protein
MLGPGKLLLELRSSGPAVLSCAVCYLVKARVRPGKSQPLLKAIDDQTLGKGSIAGDEYVHNMSEARLNSDGVATWVETCFCDPPLAEERRIGKNISIFSALRTRTRAGIVVTKTAPNRGPAAIAIAQNDLSKSWRTKVSPFWSLCA